MYGFESRIPLQPFYISIDNRNGRFAAKVRGECKGVFCNSIALIVKRLRHFPSTENMLVRFQLKIIQRLVFMVDSSKRSGGLPLTQKIVGSSPLSTTIVMPKPLLISAPPGFDWRHRRKPDSVYKIVVRLRCGSDRTITAP